MTSHSEIALVDTAEQPAAPKARKTRARRAAAPKRAKRATSRKTSKPAKETQATGTGIIPVMTLRAIDIVDDAKPKNTPRRKTAVARAKCPHVIQMPPPHPSENPSIAPEGNATDTNANGAFDIPTDINGEPLVTDPELLELLEQLSVTIETANTVLDAAATLPAEAEEIAAESEKPETAESPEQKAETAPESKPAPAPEAEPAPEPAPAPGTDTEDLPPLAARLAPESAPAPAPQKGGIGFGLVANTALTGLVFAAGVAWVLHTNPWLLEGKTTAPVNLRVPVTKPETKVQSSLQTREMTLKRITAVPGPALASFTPPDDDPVPMESVTPPAPVTGAAMHKPARGPAGQPIALNITLPAGQGSAEMSVMIQGVPDNAKLSAGKSLGAGNWLLNAPQLEGVTLTAGKGIKPGNYELEVILVRSDGKVPETRKIPVTVEPVAVAAAPSAHPAAETKASLAAPAAVSEKTIFAKPGVAIQVASRPVSPAPDTAMSRLAPQEVRMLLTRGDALLREGDVAGARLLLEYAANSGSKQAMVKLGNSFDPEHLAKLGVRGVQPNEARAIHWYDRAAKSAAAQ